MWSRQQVGLPEALRVGVVGWGLQRWWGLLSLNGRASSLLSKELLHENATRVPLLSAVPADPARSTDVRKTTAPWVYKISQKAVHVSWSSAEGPAPGRFAASVCAGQCAIL